MGVPLNKGLPHNGMMEYYETFVQAGFEDLDSLCDIQQIDLHVLNVKIGNRRKLQRRLAILLG
jgi:hypothetical protein